MNDKKNMKTSIDNNKILSELADELTAALQKRSGKHNIKLSKTDIDLDLAINKDDAINRQSVPVVSAEIDVSEEYREIFSKFSDLGIEEYKSITDHIILSGLKSLEGMTLFWDDIHDEMALILLVIIHLLRNDFKSAFSLVKLNEDILFGESKVRSVVISVVRSVMVSIGYSFHNKGQYAEFETIIDKVIGYTDDRHELYQLCNFINIKMHNAVKQKKYKNALQYFKRFIPLLLQIKSAKHRELADMPIAEDLSLRDALFTNRCHEVGGLTEYFIDIIETFLNYFACSSYDMFIDERATPFQSLECFLDEIANDQEIIDLDRETFINWLYIFTGQENGLARLIEIIKKEPNDLLPYKILQNHLAYEVKARRGYSSLIQLWPDVIVTLGEDVLNKSYKLRDASSSIYYSNVDEICEILDNAVELHPKQKEIFLSYFDLIYFYKAKKDYGKVIHCLKKCEELHLANLYLDYIGIKNEIDIYFELGNAYVLNDEYDNAIEAYKKSQLRIGYCRDMLIAIYLKMGRNEDVISFIEAVHGDVNEKITAKNAKLHYEEHLDNISYEGTLAYVIANGRIGNIKLKEQLIKQIRGEKYGRDLSHDFYNDNLYYDTLECTSLFVATTPALWQKLDLFSQLLLDFNLEDTLLAMEVIFGWNTIEAYRGICKKLHQVCLLVENKAWGDLQNTIKNNRHITEFIDNFIAEMAPGSKDLDKTYQSEGEDLFIIKFKIFLLEYLDKIIGTEDEYKYKKSYDIMHGDLSGKRNHLQDEFKEQQQKKDINEAKLAERDKILANLAHSIKNLISSVQTPLQLVAGDNELDEYNKFSVDNALKGLELIKHLAFSVDHSYTGAIEDFIFDAKCGEDEGQSIEELIFRSLIYATGNMFDRKYFEKPSFRYFPKGEKEQRLAAKEAYDATINELDLKRIAAMLNRHFFNFSFDVDETVKNRLQDTKSSATKFFIMLQEIIMNAVKYASFTARAERFIAIEVKTVDDMVVIVVKNSMKLTSREKTTGMGHVVIANIARMLGGESEMKKIPAENAFETRVRFKNLWNCERLHYDQTGRSEYLKASEGKRDYKK